MRRQNIYRVMLVAFILLFSAAEASDITLRTDVARIQSYELAQQKLATDWAAKNNYPLRMDDKNKSVRELVGFIGERPLYLQTLNIGAAHTSHVDQLWPSGLLNLNLSGSGMTKVAVWDGGTVFDQHQEFKNGSTSRVTLQDNASHIHHATHVAGTIMASGIVNQSKGMAFGTRLDSYDWSSDLSEMYEAAENGLLLSNHSYGIVAGWSYGSYSGNSGWHWLGDSRISEKEDYIFGYYDSTPRSWDQLMHQYPNYLVIQAAGNDRNNTGPGPGGFHYYADYSAGMWKSSTTTRDADGGSNGYDSLLPRAVMKNGLTVGAVSQVDNYTGAGSVQMSSFSGWGPTDDGRIKPDIVAKGVSTYSTTYSSSYPTDTGRYTYGSGTSMATPSVTGTLVLLREYYQTTTSKIMRSATLKALVIHTADEAGSNPGPDYKFGWGLIDAEKAAEIIRTDNTSINVLEELTLVENSEYTRRIYANQNEPLAVTIAWTDPLGPRPMTMVDPPTRILVNDVDIHLEDAQGNTYYPWTLNPASPASAAVQNKKNDRDNVEQVYITNPTSSYYDIVVNHDGSLSGGQQNFSIVMSGLSSTPAPLPIIAGPNYPEYGQVISEFNIELNWQSVEDASEYHLYFGTNNPPTNMINGQVVNDTTWNIELEENTNYYWQAIPVVDGEEVPADENWAFNTIEVVLAIPYSEDMESLSVLPEGWTESGASSAEWFIMQAGNYSTSTALACGNSSAFGSTAVTENIDRTLFLRPIYLDAEYGYQFRLDYKAANTSSNDQFNIGLVTEMSLDNVLAVSEFSTNGNTSAQVALVNFYPPESGTYYIYVQDVSEANQSYGLITDNFQLKRYTAGIPTNFAATRIGYNRARLTANANGDDWLEVEVTNTSNGKSDTSFCSTLPAHVKRLKPKTEYSVRARYNHASTHITSRWSAAITLFTNKTPPGQCILFDGITEYFNFIPGTGIQSVEFWIYPKKQNQVIAQIGDDEIRMANSKIVSSPRIASMFVNGCNKTTVVKNAWSHVVLNLASPISGELVEIGRSANGYFQGKMDELLLFTAQRNQTQVKSSMCRFPEDNEPNLYLRYHFEENLFELIGENEILQGMGDGAFLSTFAADNREESTIPVGENGMYIDTTEPQVLGVEGSEMTVTALSETDSANYLLAYVIGEGDVWVVEETEQKVADIVWGVQRTGSIRADLEFDYSGFEVVESDDNLVLLRRLDKESPWMDVTAEAEWDKSTDIITITNTTDFGEYALGEGDYPTLDINLATFQAVRDDSVISLEWQLAPGSQTAAFRVYRHYDGQSMHKISDIPVTNLLSINNTFQATDVVAANKNPNYYLEEISVTGSSAIYGPFAVSVSSGIADHVELPTEFAMQQNYPNPFNSSTVIEYSLNEGSRVTMQVYDVLGRLVITLINENQTAGAHKVNWQATAMPTGVYWVVLHTKVGTLRQKVLYVR